LGARIKKKIIKKVKFLGHVVQVPPTFLYIGLKCLGKKNWWKNFKLENSKKEKKGPKELLDSLNATKKLKGCKG